MPPPTRTSSAAPPEDVFPGGQADRQEAANAADAVALWPVVCLAFLGVMSAMVAALRFPLGPVSVFIVLALAVPVGVGLWRAVRVHRRWRIAVTVLLPAVLAVWLVGLDFTGHALPDTPSFSPDAWAYNAIADYFEHFPRGRDAGMNTLDQYGSVHQDNRLLSATTLAVLRHVLGNLSAANYLFLAFCLGGHFLSLFFFAHALSGNRAQALAAAFLGTAASWVCDAVMLGNYDNLLFMAFSPAVLGVAVRLLRRPQAAAGGTITPGFRRVAPPAALLLAAILYGYPEGAALTAVLAAPLGLAVLVGCLPTRGGGWSRAWTLAGIGALTALLVLPNVSIFVGFLHRQMSASLAAQTDRPGEGLLPGLLQARFLPAIFALGDESPRAVYGWPDLLLAVLLLCLTLVGAVQIGRRHWWFPWCGVLLLVLAGWIGSIQHYDYGLYKVIFCGGWWIYPGIAAGFWRLTENRFTSVPAVRVGLAVALLAAVGTVRSGDRKYRVLPPGSYTMNTLLDLRTVPALVGDAPLAVGLDNQLDELWAVFYLRRLHLLPIGSSNYLDSAKPSLARGQDGQLQISDCRFLLVSGAHPRAIWHDARCSLIPADGTMIVRTESPNGQDLLGDAHVLWLGTQPLVLIVKAEADGEYALRSGRFTLGPGLPGSTQRNLQVTDAGPPATVVVDERTTMIPLHLRRGENRVELRCLDTPTVRRQPNGDTRELLLALSDIEVVRVGPP